MADQKAPPKALRDKGLVKVSDNLEPGQKLKPKLVSAHLKIFFQQELLEFLERYQERQEKTPCQVSEESTAGTGSEALASNE